MAPPNASLRRAFTSTKTSTSPSSTTKSSSPTDERRLRATIRYPLCRRYSSAADSPSCPNSFRGSKRVTESSLELHPDSSARGAMDLHGYVRAVRLERMSVGELHRGHVEQAFRSEEHTSELQS